ncbi:MAG: TlpA disulfide reductase family protein [Pyrinomonadaceae bacterium]
MIKSLTILLAILFLSSHGVNVTVRAQGIKPAGVAIRKDASIRLKGLDGKFYDTTAMRGDVLVVSFGATWCTPCNWELVAIEELKEEYAGKPVKFIWVSIDDDRRTSKYLLRQFVKDRGMTITVLRDPKLEAFLQFFDTERIPAVVFFDREGRVALPTHRGMASEISDYKRLVRERVNTLLKNTTDKSSVADDHAGK